ncbi:hypothetical protein K456DRAFT_960658 [Colletotrichum gloeosporioides 23]|nr:hypothetical protein K456DRAFT_960658 [Colletotrichum gloeosporioides 23]
MWALESDDDGLITNRELEEHEAYILSSQLCGGHCSSDARTHAASAAMCRKLPQLALYLGTCSLSPTTHLHNALVRIAFRIATLPPKQRQAGSREAILWDEDNPKKFNPTNIDVAVAVGKQTGTGRLCGGPDRSSTEHLPDPPPPNPQTAIPCALKHHYGREDPPSDQGQAGASSRTAPATAPALAQLTVHLRFH